MYLLENWQAGAWGDASYFKFNLLGKTLRYTVDLSNVGCGVVATLYFSAMGRPNQGDPNYCDISADAGGCFELDIMEANSRGYEVSLHTRTGRDFDGSCNEMGCSTNMGRYPFTIERPRARTTSLYGPGAYIDSRRPFQVVAVMDQAGGLRVQLEQQHDVPHTLPVYNRSAAWNFPEISDFENETAYPAATGIPDEDLARVAPAMRQGLTLVTSLWSTSNTRWLDMTGCKMGRRADLDRAGFSVSGLSLRPTGAELEEDAVQDKASSLAGQDARS